MAYTPASDSDVRSLVSMDTNSSTAIYLQASVLVITEDLAGKGLSDSRLTLIAKYVAAHYAVVSEELGGLTSQATNNTKDTYQSVKGGPGYNATRFGQQAIQLDTSGTLAALSNISKGKAKIRLISDCQFYASGIPPVVPVGG